ncbi:DUF1638 domain-containing protein [Coralliovum pocilloporae]|uniref:DUF1638 domain-containing protein n=1 Tax=Coralliovum pocilloporae TaxID=3066369 RepID=UPI003D9C22CD
MILACGALAREILALIKQDALSHVTLHCLPAILHNSPEKIPDAVRASIREHRSGYDRILIGYGDCGTGGLLDKVLEEEGAERIGGPHCYAFFTGLDEFAEREDDYMQAFFLTDFLARHFDAFVTKPLGLDRFPELRDMYFGHYQKVVYLAQTHDAELERQAREGAEKLGLDFEIRFTGYGDLAPFVTSP